MQVRLRNVESQIEANLPVSVANNFGLEMAELEMILAMKVEEELDFDTAVRSALLSSGNQWLFDFPAERFPVSGRNVAAICLQSGEDRKVCYVCESDDGAAYKLLDERDLDEGYIEFAASYASVADAMDTYVSKAHYGDVH